MSSQHIVSTGITQRMRAPGWWIWLVITILIALSLFVAPQFMLSAIAVSIFNAIWQLRRHEYRYAFAVEVRTTYTLLLLLGMLPMQQWIHWIQLFGTSALLTFDYCPLARMLSLTPWHLRQPITRQAVLHAMLSKPVGGKFVGRERWQP
jgi:hypothetical protein